MKTTLLLLGSLLALAACSGPSPVPLPVPTPASRPTPTPAPTPTPTPTPSVVGANFELPAALETYASAFFHNTSQNAASYKWSFGDGSTSTQADPTHTYTKAGTYTVTLRAYNLKPDSASTSKTCTVQVNANDLFVHAPIKILGDYDYKLVTVGYYNSPTQATAHSSGVLTLT